MPALRICHKKYYNEPSYLLIDFLQDNLFVNNKIVVLLKAFLRKYLINCASKLENILLNFATDEEKWIGH